MLPNAGEAGIRVGEGGVDDFEGLCGTAAPADCFRSVALECGDRSVYLQRTTRAREAALLGLTGARTAFGGGLGG